MAFATVEDYKSLSPVPVPEGQEALIEKRLEAASVWLYNLYPQIPEHPEGRLAVTLETIVCSMVRRALNTADTEGYSQYNETAGTFSVGFRSDGQGNFFLYRAEREQIESALGAISGTAGSFEAFC